MALWMFLLSALQTAEPQPRHYRCLDDTTFELRLTDELAVVRFSDGEYRLPRRSSALAIKYATDQATLYLDGEFAAFVAEDRPLPGCIRASPVERG